MLLLRRKESEQRSLILSNLFRKTRQDKGRNRMQRITAINSGINTVCILTVNQTVSNVTFLKVLKLSTVLSNKLIPKLRILLNNGRNDFIHLRKVIMKGGVFKAAGYTSPTIYLLLRKIVVDIVRNILVADKHKVHLLLTAAHTLLCKILQELNIADGCIAYARLKIFTEFVINNVNAIIPNLTELVYNLLIEFDNVKSKEGVEATSGSQARI